MFIKKVIVKKRKKHTKSVFLKGRPQNQSKKIRKKENRRINIRFKLNL